MVSLTEQFSWTWKRSREATKSLTKDIKFYSFELVRVRKKSKEPQMRTNPTFRSFSGVSAGIGMKRCSLLRSGGSEEGSRRNLHPQADPDALARV